MLLQEQLLGRLLKGAFGLTNAQSERSANDPIADIRSTPLLLTALRPVAVIKGTGWPTQKRTLDHQATDVPRAPKVL